MDKRRHIAPYPIPMFLHLYIDAYARAKSLSHPPPDPYPPCCRHIFTHRAESAEVVYREHTRVLLKEHRHFAESTQVFCCAYIGIL